MNKEINLGNLIIPIIKPQKGKDYYTETEKQELISIVTDNVNAGVLPQEQTRQSNEIIRQNNEQTRQAQETIRQTNETNRQTAETERESAENTRQSNESSRVSAEQTRTQTFNNKMDAVDTAIAGIHTSQNAYDQNATAKTSAFNENATSKTSDYNTNATNKTAEYNENASTKIAEYDAHIRDYEAELATKVDKVIGKGLSSNDFTNEEKAKLAELHNYDDTELSERVDDIEQEQTTQNTNISTNATNIESLQSENENLKKIVAQMPQVTGQGTEITLENTIEAQFTKFDVEGNSVQDGSPSPDNEVPIKSAGDNGFINEKISNENIFDGIMEQGAYSGSDGTTLISSPKYIRSKNYTNVVAGETYIITIKAKGTNQTNGNIFIYNIDETLISTINGLLNSFTIPTGGRKIKINVFNNNNIAPSDVEFAMMNIGSTSIPYVPHKEQTYSMPVQAPFRSIGDIRDCFVNVNGNWFERHYIGEKILNGTENWSISGNQNYFYYANNDFPTISGTGGVLPDMKCNYYQISTYNHIYNANDDYGVTLAINNNHFLALRNKEITTIAELKTWLSTHNVTINYLLAEPLDLPCTEEQIEALENLPSTYKDFTIIQSQDETEAYLEVSGIYDLNKLITRTEVLESEV